MDIIREKIEILYDMQILKHNGRKHDPREKAVRKWLKSYDSVLRMENTLRDIYTEKTTLNQVLTQRGFM